MSAAKTKPSLYHFEDHPGHREQLDPWAKKWIANAMSTKAMDEAERELCREAVVGLYAAAKLPPPKHIVFVPSPFVLAFAGGFASALWHMSKNSKPTWAATGAATWDATRDATRDATGAATRDATGAATRDATWDATRDATGAATGAATWAATGAATRDATRAATGAATGAATRDATGAATRDATRDATGAATRDATRDATDLSKWYVVNADMKQIADEIGVSDFGLRCAANAFSMWQYGNQDSGYDAYLSFFQDMAKLSLDYSAYKHWRTLAEHSGPRIIHPDFCMISDRPEVLRVDAQNQPHCEDGPFCRWRDGSALYAWHGSRVPAKWIEHRAMIDPNEVIRHENVELRAAGAAIAGWPKMLDVLKAKVIDDSGSPSIGQLIELSLPGLDEPGRFLKAHCPRNGIIVEGVPNVSDIDNLPIETALHAQAWRIGDPLSEYQHPPSRT